MADGLRLALSFFTVLPVRPGSYDRTTATRAMTLLPVIGLGLATTVSAVLVACRVLYYGSVLGSLLASAVAIAALAVFTRGLHLDGLVDLVDGLASYAPRERALEIMRAPGIGALGAVVLVLSLVLQILALTYCVARHRGTEAVFVALLAGRLAVLWSCTAGVPAARPDGLGAVVAGTVPRAVAIGWTVVLVAASGAFGYLDPDGGSAERAVRVVAAYAAALLASAVLLRHVRRRLGGVTGDVFGAVLEIATTVALLVLAVDPHDSRPPDAAA